jgi:Xaa-Pro dipeptidase
LDALVCRLPENVLLLSGHWPLAGMTFLYFPVDGTPLCVVPHCDEREAREELRAMDCVTYTHAVLGCENHYEAVAKAFKKAIRGRRPSRVGFEGGFECVAAAWNTAEACVPASATCAMLESVFRKKALVDATDLFHGLRARKTAQEQDRLRRVNEIAAMGLRAFHEKVAPGISGIELLAHVEHAIMIQGTGYKGARRVRAFAQVATGADETAIGYRPMEITTTRKLAPGDLALLELGVVADGFWADRTRVRAAGRPTPLQEQVFETVLRAQQAAIAAIKPGVKAAVVDEAARAIIRFAGYDKEFLHVTGHGLGFRYHEPIPLLCPGGTTVMEEGMVHSVEPGVYIADMGGIRIEDDILVTATGAEVMGPCEARL